ncbi:MAG: hypothetical protein ACFE85_20055 [Candidatus Hodarchaeota archaeon]
MNRYESTAKKRVPNEVVGKFFILNKIQDKPIKGWINVDNNLKEFLRNLKEEIESAWDLEKIFIENYLLYYIDIDNNSLVHIKDNKTLNVVRRNNKIFIVLLDKRFLFDKIEDLEPLAKWYNENLVKYES